MARTLVTQDPIFGWIAYGGSWTEEEDALSVVPRDGLRRRFDVVLADERAPWLRARRLKLELNRDGLAAGEPVQVDKRLDRIAFSVENRTGDTHEIELSLWLPYGRDYVVTQDGVERELILTGDWDYPWRVTLPMRGDHAAIQITRKNPE